MKTQIKELHRGSADIIGTPHALREEVARKVNGENPLTMEVKVSGHKLHLTCNYSQSGKNFDYSSDQLSTEQVKKIIPDDTRAINHPELVWAYFHVNGDMTCEYVILRRRTERCVWRYSSTIPVEEKEVEIL